MNSLKFILPITFCAELANDIQFSLIFEVLIIPILKRFPSKVIIISTSIPNVTVK